jgi:PIN domain nuclease of toxin-antitoxin system
LNDAYLADACALIVYHADAGRGMSPEAMGVMHAGDVAVSAITIWEITKKVSAGRLAPLPLGPQGSFTSWLRHHGYRLLPIEPAMAERANALPPHHADPMDRMLIATAELSGRRILTCDRAFAAYNVPVLW